MTALAQLLNEHYDNHPDMEVQDAVKFLYQSHMGPGHLIPDEQASLARLQGEWDALEGDPDIPLSEEIGNGLCRLNLSACKGKGLSTGTINRLFVLTAQAVKSDLAALEKDLDLVRQLPFSTEEADGYLARYRREGCPMVSHSPRYRDAYSPAYRIVSKCYVDLIPALTAIDWRMETTPHLRVAIDGPCASGKSTLGEALSEVYRCPLIHMDDFFLRPEQRTPERLAQPGGNVDYERFDREVLSPLCQGEAAQYHPWSCQSSDFGPEVTVPPSPLTIVEGSYSLRPDLRDGYQLRIWVEAPWKVREQRLLERGGPGCLTRFNELWIPMENRYFEAFEVKNCCHVILSGAQ